MKKKATLITTDIPRCMIIGVDAPYHVPGNENFYFEEFINLIKANGLQPVVTLSIKLRSIDPTFFFTKGKVQEIGEICAREDIEEIIVSEQLDGKQQRNLARTYHCEVFDRTDLILDIFEKRAISAEGKIQVQIARLQHRKSRLAGQGTSFSQQGGGIGARGPGRTYKESTLAHLEHLELKLRRDLLHLEKIRETQRKQRISSNIPLLCFIGYTNAGKSTLFNSLTKSNVIARDQLFSTLETTTRELFLAPQKKVLVADTVGFIQQLPHQLIAAFKATLTELQYAHILLHVIDASNPHWEEHIKTVDHLLNELNIEKPVLYIFNKKDKIPDITTQLSAMAHYEPHIIISAQEKEGIQLLLNHIQHWYSDTIANKI